MNWTRGSSNNQQSPFIDSPKQSYTPNPNQRREGVNRNTSKPSQGRDYTSPNNTSLQTDVAATFTKDGLQTFAQIFSTSVEAAIAKVLPDMIERVVEQKLTTLLRETVTEINESVANHVAAVTSGIREDIHNQMNARNASTPEKCLEECVVETPKQDSKTQSRLELEVHSVIQALERSGGRLTAQQLRSAASGIDWGTNGAVKMNSIIRRSNGRIERVSKGVYQITDN